MDDVIVLACTSEWSETKQSWLETHILTEFAKGGLIGKYYPWIFDPGIAKGEVHSVVLSFLVILGAFLDFSPISDVSGLDPKLRVLTNLEADRRPDSTWRNRSSAAIDVLFEVESTDLEDKARNLVIFADHARVEHPFRYPALLVLLWWGTKPPSIGALKSTSLIFTRGFKEAGSTYSPPKCPALFVWLRFEDIDSNSRLESVKVLGYFANGCNLPKAVDTLNKKLG